MGELKTEGKHITRCKIVANMEIKVNEAVKETIRIPETATTRLFYIDYYPAIRRVKV